MKLSNVKFTYDCEPSDDWSSQLCVPTSHVSLGREKSDPKIAVLAWTVMRFSHGVSFHTRSMTVSERRK